MKKEFERIVVEVVLIDVEDIVKTSGEVEWWPEDSGKTEA